MRAFILRLYPRRWRERYGDEMAAMLADVRLTPAAVLDLVAGAIDARVTPQSIPGRHGPVQTETEKAMFNQMVKLCAGSRQLTRRDNLIGAAVMLGLTLVFSGVYIWAAYQYRGNELVDALGIMAFPAAMFLSMPFTYLKGHSRVSQVVIIGGCLGLIAAASLLAARI